MSKKIILILIIFFSLHSTASADVLISEIMYDLSSGSDDSREWVEIYNNSDEEVDLSTFKFFEADTNHKLTLTQGADKIPAKGYAVIVSNAVKFKTDWPSFAGIIFDSAFSLSNSGETLALKDGDEVVDQYTYNSSSGGAGDGKSLQLVNGSWVASIPTPGAENKIYIPPPPPPKPPAPITSARKDLAVEIPMEPAPPVTRLNFVTDSSFSGGTAGIPSEENSSPLFTFILFPLLGAGAGAVYFIRKKQFTPDITGDFEILEE